MIPGIERDVLPPKPDARGWSSAGLSLPSLDVPVDPLVGVPTGRVFIVEPIENSVPPYLAHRTTATTRSPVRAGKETT